jgi:nitrous oxidase accessory protein
MMKRLKLICAFIGTVSTGYIAQGATLEVCSSCTYKTIHSALKAAQPGDEIVVKGGTYKEGNILIDKPVRLIGQQSPVIDGRLLDEMVTIIADGVVIEGFDLRNSGSATLKDIAAIHLMNVRYCRILNNRLYDNFFGIYLANSKHCLVAYNSVKGGHDNESNSGNGIHSWKCDSNEVIGNTIVGHRDGLYFEFTKHTNITGNLSTKNLRYGLHFMFSDGNVYERNIFRNNGSGVAVMYTQNIIMRDNVFEANWGAASYGLLLKTIDRSIIEHNLFSQNTVGIYMEGSGKLHIRDNEFRGNGWGLKIMASCTDDTLQHNNFIANTFDIATNGSLNANLFTENYWDKYRGYDLDKNGIGDVPFRPVSLFSMVIEKIPNSVMLMRSMVSEILDQVEKVRPDVIPESLVDEKPAMHLLHLESEAWDHEKSKQTGKQPHKKAPKDDQRETVWLKPQDDIEIEETPHDTIRKS